MDFEEINTVQIRDDATRFNTNAFKKYIYNPAVDKGLDIDGNFPLFK
jgi:hypothetical protein